MVRSYESTIKQHFEETYGPAKSHQEARDPPSGDSMGLDSWFLIVYDGKKKWMVKNDGLSWGNPRKN